MRARAGGPHPCNPSPGEAEAVAWLQVPGPPRLQKKTLSQIPNSKQNQHLPVRAREGACDTQDTRTDIIMVSLGPVELGAGMRGSR